MLNIINSSIISNTAITTTESVIFTAHSSVILFSIVLNNGHFSSLPVTVKLYKNSDFAYLAKNVSIDPGTSFDVSGGIKLALTTGDTITAVCPIAGVYTGLISYYEDK